MLIPVTSLDDPRLADYRRAAEPRAITEAGLFVAEGRWVVQRLLAQPQFVTRSVLTTPTAYAALANATDADVLAPVPVYVIAQAQMDAVVGFNIHRGCLALGERPEDRRLTSESLDRASRVIVLEGVNNPDNIGGIFRSAAAFAVDLVVLGPSCGDPLYRKAIRTSMGATLDVPFLTGRDWPDALDAMRSAGIRVVALTPQPEALPLESMVRESRVALLLGSEGAGLTPEACARADARVRIRTSGRVDSLNVTVAASIALHHFFAGVA